MPYTHVNPEIQEAVARLVAVMSRKRAVVDPGIAEATIEADQSGKPTVAKKTRYTTMSRFNAAEVMRRRERRRVARNERKSERLAKELAIEEAANFLSPKAAKVPKVPKTPRKTRVTTNIVKMTPGRRTAAA